MSVISVVIRDAAGALHVLHDKVAHALDEAHAELDALLAKLKAEGHAMVAIFASDDSILRHWTKPADEPAPAPQPDRKSRRKERMASAREKVVDRGTRRNADRGRR